MLKNAGDIGLALTVIPKVPSCSASYRRKTLSPTLLAAYPAIRPQGCRAKKRLKIANLGCARSQKRQPCDSVNAVGAKQHEKDNCMDRGRLQPCVVQYGARCQSRADLSELPRNLH